MPDEYFGRFPGGGTAIGKGDEGPEHPPPGHIQFPLYTFMENDTLPAVPNPGGEFPANAVRLPVLDDGGDDTFQIGEGFKRYA
jgi:hypothetical protein